MIAATNHDTQQTIAGVIGADVEGRGIPCEQCPLTSRLAIISGTSSCLMAV